MLPPPKLQTPPDAPWTPALDSEGGSESPSPLGVVNVDSSRSADPPTSSGSLGASPCRVASDALRVAKPFGSAGKTGGSASQPRGSSPAKRRASSEPSS